MNFFKRATTSILRRLDKTIILLLLIFILGTAISGTIYVKGAVRNTEANLRRRMRPIVTFQHDWEAFNMHIEELGLSWNDPDVPPVGRITPEMIREIAALPYVEYSEYSLPVDIEVEGLRNFNLREEGDGSIQESDVEMVWLEMRGTAVTELLQVREKVVEIVEGRTFEEIELTTVTDINPIIISAGFARVNGLYLGDIIDLPNRVTFPQPVGMWDRGWALNPENIFAEEKLVFKVIGIFDSVAEIDLEDQSIKGQLAIDRLDSALNTLHISNATAEAMQRFILEQHSFMLEYMIETGMEIDKMTLQMLESVPNNEEELLYISSVMLLNDPLKIDEFTEAAEAIMPNFWVVVDLAAGEFDVISSSMESLQRIAFWGLVISVGATVLILSLLITLFLHDRRYEVGVYLTLGEKKGKIILQILLETILTAIVGITLAVFAGNVISDMISRNMLRNELVAEQTFEDGSGRIIWSELDNLGLSSEMSIEEKLDAFDVSINFQTIGLFYTIGLGTVTFSTIVPIIYIVTLNPKKVLT